MDRFIALENIRHFRDRLWSESDPDTRLRLHRLLLAEEDKLAADLEVLADIERHIADGNGRIERQQGLVANMRLDGHRSLSVAQALLDGMIETQHLHVQYREHILIKIKDNRL
jgi:hypothetical protein